MSHSAFPIEAIHNPEGHLLPESQLKKSPLDNWEEFYLPENESSLPKELLEFDQKHHFGEPCAISNYSNHNKDIEKKTE